MMVDLPWQEGQVVDQCPVEVQDITSLAPDGSLYPLEQVNLPVSPSSVPVNSRLVCGDRVSTEHSAFPIANKNKYNNINRGFIICVDGVCRHVVIL